MKVIITRDGKVKIQGNINPWFPEAWEIETIIRKKPRS